MAGSENSSERDSRARDGVLRWRALAWLYLAGALIGLASVLLPHAAAANDTALWSNIGLAFAGAAVGGFLAPRLPLWLNHVYIVAGILIVTRAIYLSGDPGSYYAIWYIWIAVYAFYFCTRRAAVAHLTLVAACYGVVLVVRPADFPAARWVTTVGTMLIAAVFVDSLIRQLRRHAARLAVLADQLEAVASTDDLTGLPNRRAWDAELARALAHARRFEQPVCVGVLDLDDFKGLNDERGHAAGDALLREAAQRWSSELRSVDTLARWGGDEFTVIVPGCDAGAASEAIERVRRSTPPGTTCSAGVVAWDGVEDESALMARADAALYDAKRGGRDRLSALALPEERLEASAQR